MDVTLGVALAGTAGAVLLGLALHGWWSTRRAQPKVMRGADEGAAARVEPALEGQPAPAAEVAPVAELRPPARRSPRLDALIDAIVTLRLEAPIAGEVALQHLPPSRRAGSKAFYVEGLDADSGQWEPIDAGSSGRRYGELQAGVQLASRGGALNEIEYSEFVQKIEAFAEQVGAVAELPDMLDVVARARELDTLAAPLDAQLGITLRANGVAWSVAYLQQAAARLGFVPGVVPGRFVLPGPDDGAPPVLVLAVDAQAALAAADTGTVAVPVRECTLSLDVPQTPAAAEPFPAWHRAATELAQDLDASTVDNEGVPVTLHAYAGIGQELQQLYA